MGYLTDLDLDLDGSGVEPKFDVDGYIENVTSGLEDPEIAYNVGRESDPEDRCPYKTRAAIEEWERGQGDADRHEVYSIRHGTPADRYRDPDEY